MLPLDRDQQPDNPPPAIDGVWRYPYCRLSCASIDVQTTAEGRYGGYFASATVGASHHVFEFAALHPVLSPSSSGDLHAYGRWLIGTLASSKSTVSFSAAVAAATAGGSTTAQSNTFRGRTRGIPDAEWARLRELSGKLDADSIRNLGSALAQSLDWCTGDHGEVRPGAVFEVRSAAYDEAASGVFALNRIKRGSSFDDARRFLDDALASGGKRSRYSGVDILTVRAMYHRMGVVDAPTDEQQRRARDIVRGGVGLPAKSNTRRGFWYDVPPYVTQNGAAPGLDRVAPPSRLAIHAWPIASFESPPVGETGGYTIDVETALRLGVSGLVDIGAGVDARFHGYGFTSAYTAPALPGTILLNEKYVAGFRVRVRATGSDADLGIAALAAKSTVQATEVAYEIEALGIDIGALDGLPGFVGASIGKFDVTTLNALGLLYQEASSVLTSHGPGWMPVLSAVEIDLGAPEVQALTDRAAALLGSGQEEGAVPSGPRSDLLLLGD